MDELVSVIVAVYNVELYLEQCIESICSQSYQNIEIILVDDGSKDKSGFICDMYQKKDNRIKVIHQKNAGVSTTRNIGIRVANGKYISFIDSDDYIEATYIQKLVEQANKHFFPICGYVIDIDTERNRSQKIMTYGHENVTYLDKADICLLYQHGLLNSIWNKLYCTEILKKENIYFEENMSLGEDALFNYSYICVTQCKYAIIKDALYHYMKRGLESLDNKYKEDFFDVQTIVFNDVIKLSKKLNAKQNDIATFYKYYFNALVVALDNLYCNRKNMDRNIFLQRKKDILSRNEYDQCIDFVTGRQKFVCCVRLWLIRHGFFVIDFHLREIIKRMLNLK